MSKEKLTTSKMLLFCSLLFLNCQGELCLPLHEGSPWDGICQSVVVTETNSLPPIRVEGNHIENPGGTQVILRGVSLADPFFLSNENLSNHYCEYDLYVLSSEWGANIIRVPIHPDLWQRDSNYMEKYVDPLVKWSKTHGLYILLDWHAHGNPVTGQTEHPQGENKYPWHGNPYNPDLNLAIVALTSISKRYRNEPSVLYECFNEPAFITWDEWRPIAEELIDTVQSQAPEALILISGTDWGYDISGAINNPVTRNNFVYSIHAYPGKGNSWKEVAQKLISNSPVIIGEWGYREFSCNSNLDATAEGYAIPLLSFAEQIQIGWIAWVWHPFWEPPLLASWNEYQPTEFGSLVKSALTHGK